MPRSNRRSRELFGKELSEHELANLVGAPNGTRVSVYSTPPARAEAGLLVQVYDSNGAFSGIRHVFKENGQLVLHNELLTLKKNLQGQGLGTSIFAKQVEGARVLGVSEIRTTAAKNKNMNGYYTWPRVGYNADLPAKYARKLPDSLKDAKTFHDLYAKPGGRDWWKANGGTVDMHFDLKSGSASLRVFNAYRAERGLAAVRTGGLYLNRQAEEEASQPAAPLLTNDGDFADFNEDEDTAAEKIWDRLVQSARFVGFYLYFPGQVQPETAHSLGTVGQLPSACAPSRP